MIVHCDNVILVYSVCMYFCCSFYVLCRVHVEVKWHDCGLRCGLVQIRRDVTQVGNATGTVRLGANTPWRDARFDRHFKVCLCRGFIDNKVKSVEWCIGVVVHDSIFKFLIPGRCSIEIFRSGDGWASANDMHIKLSSRYHCRQGQVRTFDEYARVSWVHIFNPPG